MEEEARLIRLEETCYFQETLLKDLNGALISQQKQIAGLERLVASLQSELKEMKDILYASKIAQTKPPHYQESGV
ncbi:MAG: SlyX family protein [Desulfovibrio sp.]|nr:SlyX family protein [Desulfovibrio sp.]